MVLAGECEKCAELFQRPGDLDHLPDAAQALERLIHNTLLDMMRETDLQQESTIALFLKFVMAFAAIDSIQGTNLHTQLSYLFTATNVTESNTSDITNAMEKLTEAKDECIFARALKDLPVGVRTSALVPNLHGGH